ncbi:CTLH/CRA C-terminal to lish motif domain-containing protein [Scheffersomyces amazonensis]|uniref:CTLH/CRA C-terminal to lish motif domain-containing protein n=1 Tax=Scheffersomyces amazonensis TaxID=1078765 RepID=UPI00315D7931
MTTLLDNLQSDIYSFNKVANDNLHNLWDESETLLKELKDIEQSLTIDESLDISRLEKQSEKWYKNSINNLKAYNTGINKFSKSINNPKDNIDLDEAYTYPLNLNNYPVTNKEKSSAEREYDLKTIKLENREELIKAIILHLLKIGQCDVVKEIVKELPPDSHVEIDESLLEKFELLNKIVDDIVIRHDLHKVLDWFKAKYDSIVKSSPSGILNNPIPSTSQIEFKFHMLQFILLLNSKNALDAYLYSMNNFSKFIKDYLHGISPIMTLLLYNNSLSNLSPNQGKFSKMQDDRKLFEFITKLKHKFNAEKDTKKSNQAEFKFVAELLDSFDDINKNQSLFVNIANEFISEYCNDLKLSNDSSLFQSILAGYIYLPSFYKYNQIQSKFNKMLPSNANDNGDGNANEQLIINFDATYHFDLPFQLPDSNRFLFNYHPIFICPISREQLIPITDTSDNHSNEEHKNKKKKRSHSESQGNLNIAAVNPVVVLNYCQHLALRESVWHLSKKGTEIFKCHYCYKKHKFSDVTEAYFVDL